jgi:hypothetical protein
MKAHEHKWRRLHEEFLLGGSFPIGWECSICKKFVGNSEITPAGLDGIVSEHGARIVGPHGGRGRTSGGESYREQIVDDKGVLHVIK